MSTQKIVWGAIIAAIILLSFSSAPPIGRTGAPDQGSCADSGCHEMSDTDINGEITLLGLPESYQTDSIYSLILQLSATAGSPRSAGFQMTALRPNNNGIGTFRNAGEQVTIVSTSRERAFAQHSPVKDFDGESSLSYEVEWVAPDSSEIDSVIFYIATNFVNGDGGRNGDKVILHQVVTIPDTSSTAVDMDNDGYDSTVDCDDTDPTINPDATEIANNNIDENCDGIAEMIDMDNDGWNSDLDCDDTDPTINPNAMEILDNDIDENCDGRIEQSPDSTLSIAGLIANAGGVGIQNVDIILLPSGDTIKSDAFGLFDITDIDTEVTEIQFSKRNNPGNGVSSLDLINMTNHILGRNIIDDQDVLLAADVNQDSRISSQDIVISTNVILGRNEDFAGIPSWIFAPESISLSDTTLNLQNIRIKGLKIGDLTGDADPKQ